MVQNHVIPNITVIYLILHGPKSCNIEYYQWWALQLVKLKWGEDGILVGVAVGAITEFIYSILHGTKSCKIKYYQWWALQLKKLKRAEVAILVGVITVFIYSILHITKSIYLIFHSRNM